MTLRNSRWRTKLRRVLPGPLIILVPKARNCGDHEWYFSRKIGGSRVEGCYHCERELWDGRMR